MPIRCLRVITVLAIALFLGNPTTISGQDSTGPKNDGSSQRIHDIQGAWHISPLEGSYVTKVPGVVTAVTPKGFYIQDPNPDSSNATSEGLFIYTGNKPKVEVEDFVLVNGVVSEYRAGSLSITEINKPTFSRELSNILLPDPVILGIGGRSPPNTVIEDDALGNIEISNDFDPQSDGIDFYESLEGMRVKINDAVAVGPVSCPEDSNRSCIALVPVLADDGTGASLGTSRGGLLLRPEDSNPERIFLKFPMDSKKKINVGDRFNGSVLGAMDYSGNNYAVQVIGSLKVNFGNLSYETTEPAGPDEISIATYNVNFLSPGSKSNKFSRLARQIVSNLASPDIIALEEVVIGGENSNSSTDATSTYNLLVREIEKAGGPTYNFTFIKAPGSAEDATGESNIDVGILYKASQSLKFTSLLGGSNTAATSVVRNDSNIHLSFSPGRLDPLNEAFVDSRKPLAAEFTFKGQRLFVIVNHLKSKIEDQPLYGSNQPPIRFTEDKRHKQAQIVHDFVRELLRADPKANVVVLGDMNDFQFSETLNILKGDLLIDAIERLPLQDQYTFIYQGNSQALDHILLNKNLYGDAPFEVDVVHVNAEFADQVTDHDPVVVRLPLTPRD